MMTARPAPLDPEIARLLPTMPLLDPATMTPQGVRNSLRGLPAVYTDSQTSAVRVEACTVQGAAGTLGARVYRIPSGGECPTVVFFHGGGWVAGDLDTVHTQALRLVLETNAVVVSVDYRQPPETPFPGAFEDAFAALRDVVGRIGEFGGDAARVGVAGESAGANLAAAAAIAARDAGIALAGQFLAYPATDLVYDASENARFPSRSENAQSYFISTAAVEWFAGQYLQDPERGRDWRASPLRAASLADVAPAVVATAWFDPLRDEGRAYAHALRVAGVRVESFDGPGLVHGFFALAERGCEAAAAEARNARECFKAMLATKQAVRASRSRPFI